MSNPNTGNTKLLLACVLLISASSCLMAAPIVVSSYSYDGTGDGSIPDSSFPDSSTIELTNGTQPATTAFSDPQWVGYRDGGGGGTPATADHPQITFDLGSSQEVASIVISYLHSTTQAGGTITAPDSVIVSVSDDNVTSSAPTTYSAEFDSSSGNELRAATLDVSSLSQSRYVRLEFRQSSQWTFLSEIQFEGENGGADTTPPTITGSDIADDQNGNPVTENTTVNYTLTFSEDIDLTSVSPSDFSNAGSASLTIDQITENLPGVLSIAVTPTSTGTLQLQIPAGATISDVAGNFLDTISTIPDDNTLTVVSAGGPSAITVSSYSYDGTGAGSGPSLSFPDTGITELVNGSLPASPAFGDSQWVGFQDGTGSGTPATVDHPQITFDLGSFYNLSTIDITYLHSTSQASGTITAPEELLISTSQDNVTYSSPVSFTSFDHSAGNEIRTASIDVSALSGGRYFRLEFRQSSQWTFLSEVYFFGNNDPMNPSPPHGGTVPLGDVILSWTNLAPDSPGNPVFVDVWFGTDPDKNGPNYAKVVTNGENTSTFTVNVPLEGTYYWQIDSRTGGSAASPLSEGTIYSFQAADIPPPPDITITSPGSRHIVQRSSLNIADLPISGIFNGTPGRIEARMLVMSGGSNSGTTTPWQTIDQSPTGGNYSGTLIGVPAGGWYQLEVRTVSAEANGTPAILEKIGVGDIYVTAGQSNSANHGTGGYVSSDDRVNVRNAVSGGDWIHAADPVPIATGGGGSVWTRLGDELANTHNIPIGFVAVGVGATRASQWIPGTSYYNNRLRPAILSFPLNGFKAVLWHQGESDSLASVTATAHENLLNSMISQSRVDAAWTVPWYLAEASFHPSSTLSQEERITAGQRQAVYGDTMVYLGPSTDQFHQEGKLNDGVHFNSAGLLDHAIQWRKILNETASLSPRNNDFEENGSLSDGAIHLITTNTNNSPSVIGWHALSASGAEAANGNNGFHNPSIGTFSAAADSTNNGVLTNMNGRHVAYLENGDANNHFLQCTRVSAKPHQTYTLSVALGVRDNPSTFGIARIELLANNIVVASSTFDKSSLDNLRGNDSSGSFTDVDLTWNSGANVTPNQLIAVRIFKEGGAGTVLDFDNVRLEAQNNYSAWIDSFPIDPAFKNIDDDPDNDGLLNGVEAWMGTHPGNPNPGVTQIEPSGGVATFLHPANVSPPNDLSAQYMWSHDLANWYQSGSGPPAGPNVTIVTNTNGATTTIIATPSQPTPRLFLRLSVSQN